MSSRLGGRYHPVACTLETADSLKTLRKIKTHPQRRQGAKETRNPSRRVQWTLIEGIRGVGNRHSLKPCDEIQNPTRDARREKRKSAFSFKPLSSRLHVNRGIPWLPQGPPAA